MEWKEVRLEYLADVQTGPFGSQLHNEDYVTNGTPIVTVEHLGSKTFSRQNLPMVSDEDKSRLKKYVALEGDIIFSRVGSVDRCSYVDKETNGWLFSGRCLRVRANEEIFPEYLYYYFNREEVKQYIRNIAVGATMPSINTKLLNEVPISYPEYKYQKRIADILSSLDAKIENNNKINAKLEEMAQALFKSWFIDFEPFKDGPFVESELGMIPEGWKVGTLSDISQVNSGKRPPMKQATSTTDVNIPLVGAASIMGYTNSVLYNKKILITGRVGTHGVIQRFNDSCWPSDNTLVLEPKYHEFCYQILKTIDYSSLNRGSTQPLITQSDLKKVPIVIPPLNEIEKFENIVSSLFDIIYKNDIENKNLTQTRDTLLPKLMSGEIEL